MAVKQVIKQYKTKKPSGVTIKRSNTSFTASWKKEDKKVVEQALRFRVNSGNWNTIHLSGDAKAKTFWTVNFASYAPNAGKAQLKTVEVQVQCYRNSWIEEKTKSGKVTKVTTYQTSWSDWASYTYKFTAPSTPTLTATESDQVENMATFAWSVANPTDTGNKLGWIEWKTRLLKDSNITAGAAAFSATAVSGTASSGTSTASNSKPITETYMPTGATGYTRWFAVRARGCAGDSPWVYARVNYSIPYASIMVKANAYTGTYGGLVCRAEWDSPSNTAHPIEKTIVQYAFATPEAGMQCPDNASWQDGGTVNDVKSNNSVTFSFTKPSGTDWAMYVKADNVYKTKRVEGTPMRVSGVIGKLATPTSLNVVPNSSTYMAQVSADNESDVPDSYLVIMFMTQDDPDGIKVGEIRSPQTSATVQCPEWDVSKPPRFGVYAVVEDDTGVVMRSDMVTYGGTIPAAPSNVVVKPTDISGTVRVEWEWTWGDATMAELSWSDHSDAWESTDEPSVYEVRTLHAPAWNISGLEPGITWYIRVRLGAEAGDDITYGAYSEVIPIDLASAPAIPILELSDPVVTKDGSFTASWGFVSTDGTGQASATLAELVNGDYVNIANTQTAQYAELSVKALGWSTGETHALAVRVTSASGRMSDAWSEPVSIAVADPLTISISQTSLVPETIIEDTVTRSINSLKAMPLRLTVTGAGASGRTTVAIERAEAYHLSRPDESIYVGCEGETITVVEQIGESEITITNDDLIGYLDDGAKYNIIATVQDGLGQYAKSDPLPFEVHWTHQAVMPEATAEADEANAAMILTPVTPDGVTLAEGDVCDIYRLSVDKPELIYPNAAFDTSYVDPYPAIGEFGGHRFVFKTANGDYVTEDSELAWLDLGEADGDSYESEYNIIDFADSQILLRYNVDLSNSWSKDFTETQYLGGSIQGDWNPAVSRTASVNAVTVLADNPDVIEGMRRLATYAGICHIRTKDGSSYSADIQVSESYAVNDGHKLASFSLKITRVDSESYDGMTLADWRALHPEE